MGGKKRQAGGQARLHVQIVVVNIAACESVKDFSCTGGSEAAYLITFSDCLRFFQDFSTISCHLQAARSGNKRKILLWNVCSHICCVNNSGSWSSGCAGGNAYALVRKIQVIFPVRVPTRSSKICLIFEAILCLTLHTTRRMFFLHLKLLKQARRRDGATIRWVICIFGYIKYVSGEFCMAMEAHAFICYVACKDSLSAEYMLRRSFCFVYCCHYSWVLLFGCSCK